MTDPLRAETERLLALADAATPGPWHVELGGFIYSNTTREKVADFGVSNDKNSYFIVSAHEMAEHLRTLQESYDSVSASLEASQAEVDRLHQDCAEAYQVVGVLSHYSGTFETDDVQRALDNLSAAANGLARPHDNLLPFPRQGLTNEI